MVAHGAWLILEMDVLTINRCESQALLISRVCIGGVTDNTHTRRWKVVWTAVRGRVQSGRRYQGNIQWNCVMLGSHVCKQPLALEAREPLGCEAQGLHGSLRACHVETYATGRTVVKKYRSCSSRSYRYMVVFWIFSISLVFVF